MNNDEIKYEATTNNLYSLITIRSLWMMDPTSTVASINRDYNSYLRFPSIEACHAVAELAGNKEYEIVKYDHPSYNSHNYEVVYKTPLLSQIESLQAKATEAAQKREEELKRANRIRLEQMPNDEVWTSFSNGIKVKMHYSIGPSRHKDTQLVSAGLYFDPANSNIQRPWELSQYRLDVRSYISDNQRVLKKKFISHYSFLGIPFNELENFAKNLPSYKERLRSIQGMRI